MPGFCMSFLQQAADANLNKTYRNQTSQQKIGPSYFDRALTSSVSVGRPSSLFLKKAHKFDQFLQTLLQYCKERQVPIFCSKMIRNL